jgi:hypothetical protein
MVYPFVFFLAGMVRVRTEDAAERWQRWMKTLTRTYP